MEDIHTTPIEVTKFSSDVVDEEQFLFTQIDNQSESEEQTVERKEQFWKKTNVLGSRQVTIQTDN